MIDNLKDAITHAREVAETQRRYTKAFGDKPVTGAAKNYVNLCLECAAEHEQLAAWLEELVERREADRWIPVSERLPNTLGVYNVTRKLNEGETIYFISGASYFDGQNTWYADTGINHGRPYLTDIIAWRNLPKPYESEGK